VRERRFLYDRYAAFLDRLAADPRLQVLTLRELAAPGSGEGVRLSIRHDVDLRLPSALHLAELEHDRGLRATYFILHTARYYGTLEPGSAEHDERILPALSRLQELGHEVGWHNDLVTLQVVYDIDPVEYLARELRWLRENGIDVVGTSAHGSVYCHRLGYLNNEFFLDWPGGRSHLPVEGEERELRRGRLADFGLAYDASQLGEEVYRSDASFDQRGRRWHPDLLDLGGLRPGERVIVLVHPCHWDRSLPRKYRRVLGRLARRASSGPVQAAVRRRPRRPTR
jgi:hypothetical protein